MLMVLKIICRAAKYFLRVLLVGWTPKPPSDFEERLRAVELMANATRSKVYRDGKAAEADAEPVVTVPQPNAEPYLGGPVHSDGTPVRHGDSPH